MKHINIHGTVRKMMSDAVDAGHELTVANYVDAVMVDHADISGPDADFHIICTRNYVKDVVRSCIGKYAPKANDNDAQLVLAGFEHLQVAYTVERAGQTFLVPVGKLTDIELERRAQEYEQMAAGCRSHAREIREYIAQRNGRVA